MCYDTHVLTSESQPSDFNHLNLVHIAGTKGKGSTAAFVSSILSQHLGVPYRGGDLNRVGLYISPHLRFVRERIQINNQPLSEAQFAHYFFQIWDRLEETASSSGLNPKDPSTKPVYFRFLTLMALHTYVQEKVDAAIIECGVGGEYDSTNIIDKPVVCGITSLGIDHVAMLGDTLEEIAWHKGGIMKRGVKCFTAPQKPSAMEVLAKRSEERECDLHEASIYPQILDETTPLGLNGEFQKLNASLAAAVAMEWLRSMGVKQNAPFFGELPDKVKRGLRQVHWSGRCETRKEPGILWCIDGGHTLESIELVGTWFSNQIQKQTELAGRAQRRVLVFNQQTRDANALARALHAALVRATGEKHPVTHVVFCSNTTFRDSGFRPDLVSFNSNTADVERLTVQKQLARTWADIDPETAILVVRTIEDAVKAVRDRKIEEGWAGDGVVALVTGSLHLVGGLLEVLESEKGMMDM